jgi:threonine/homoserine/homoserine lactone efflux protein
MPDIGHLLAFAGLCVVLAATPGTNLAVVLRCAVGGGQRAAVAATAGLADGKVVWAVWSVAGLATLVTTWAVGCQVARLIGAAYLTWLGIQALRAARSRHAPSPEAAPSPDEVMSARGAFRRGFLGDVLNPKVGIFYATVFPQFIGPGDDIALSAAALLGAHALVLMTWYPGVAFALGRVGRVVSRRVKALAEGALGAALVLFGVRMAFERH